MKVQLFPPLKNHFFSILFHENFNYRVLLLLKTRAKRVPFLFLILLLGFGACPNQKQEVGLLR